MKKLFFISLLLACPALLPAQTTTMQKTEPAITVTGMAELEIVPDEIYMNVTLREFTRDKKKYSIEELENALLNFVEKTTSTLRTDVKMDNVTAQVIAMKRKEKDAVIEKTYEVKYKNTEQAQLLMLAQDSLHLNSVYIKRYWHSKMEEYKQQVRVSAVTNSKEKATYMLAALGQKPGKILTMYEVHPNVTVDNGLQAYQQNRYLSDISGKSSGWDYQRQYDGGFQLVGDDPVKKTIKLNYQVQATFEIL